MGDRNFKLLLGVYKSKDLLENPTCHPNASKNELWHLLFSERGGDAFAKQVE